MLSQIASGTDEKRFGIDILNRLKKNRCLERATHSKCII